MLGAYEGLNWPDWRRIKVHITKVHFIGRRKEQPDFVCKRDAGNPILNTKSKTDAAKFLASN